MCYEYKEMSSLVEQFKALCDAIASGDVSTAKVDIRPVRNALKNLTGQDYFDKDSFNRLTFKAKDFIENNTVNNVNTGAPVNAANLNKNFTSVKQIVKKTIDELRSLYQQETIKISASTEDSTFDSFTRAIAYYYFIKLFVIVFISIQTKHLTLSQGACTRGNEESEQLKLQIKELSEQLQNKEIDIFSLKERTQVLEEEKASLVTLVQDKEKEIVDKQQQLDQQRQEKGNSNAATQKLLEDLKQKVSFCETGINLREKAFIGAVRNLEGVADRLKLMLEENGVSNVNVAAINGKHNRSYNSTPSSSADENSKKYWKNTYEDNQSVQQRANASFEIINERLSLLINAVKAEKVKLQNEIDALKKKNEELVAFMQESLPIMSDLTLSDANVAM